MSILPLLIRALLQASAGVPAAHGIEESCALSVTDAVQPLLLGGIVSIGSVLWSIIEKRKLLDRIRRLARL